MKKISLGLVACLALITGVAGAQAIAPRTATFSLHEPPTVPGLLWDKGYLQGTCADTEALLGISKETGARGAGHLVLCERTGFAAAPRTAVLVTNGETHRRIERHGDWAPGYSKLECGKDEHVVGISHTNSTAEPKRVHGLLCATGPEGHDTDAIITARAFDKGDDIGAPFYDADWDKNYYKGQCISGERVVGVSFSAAGELHSILCRGRPTTVVVYLADNGSWQGGTSLDYGKTFEPRHPFSYNSVSGAAPSVINFNGKLYYAYSNNGQLCIRTSINRGWSIGAQTCYPHISTANPPSLATWQGRLYVVYGQPSTPLFTSSLDGTTFDLPRKLFDRTGPGSAVSTVAIASFNGQLYAAYANRLKVNADVICVTQVFAEFAPKCTSIPAIAERPSMVAAFGSLYVGFRNSNHEPVFVATPDVMLPFETRYFSPLKALSTLAVNFVRGRLIASFTDTNSSLKVIHTDDGSVFTAAETPSLTRPYSAQSMVTTEVNDTVPNVRFAAYGDMPYTAEVDEKVFHQRLIPALASGNNLPFLLHLGDIGRPLDGSGANRFDSCSSTLRNETLSEWKKLNRPLVYLPGDNDWVDCNPDRACKGKVNCSSDLNPLKELKKVRLLFSRHTNLFGRSKANLINDHIWVDRNPADQNLAYLSLTVVGSDNGYVPQDRANANELNEAASARETSTLEAIDRIRDFVEDRPEIKALVVTLHVDLFRGSSDWDFDCARWDASKKRQPYKAICTKLKALPNDIRRPVLLVHGDTNAHCFWKFPDRRLWVLNGPGDFSGVDADLVSFDASNKTPFSVVSLLNSATPLAEDQSKCNYTPI